MKGMDNWITGLSILKNILEITMGNANGSKQDVRRLVQEELRMSQNSEHSEILHDILRSLEVTKDRQEDDMNLKARVEELTQKVEKMDCEKKSSETRMWMKDLLEKMILAGAERSHQYKQEERGGERGRGKGRPPRSYRPNHDMRNYNDHLPWTDGPKGGQNHFQPRERAADDSFVFVNRGDIPFNPRGSRHRGGFQRNRGQPHRSVNHFQPQQEGENIPRQNNSWRGHNNNHQRGNYRGQGRGAIPKNSSTRTSSCDVRGNQGMDEIQQLTAKLMNCSTSDAPVSLTPELMLAIKNKISENQQISKPKKQEQDQKKKNKKNKNKPQVAPSQRDEEDKDATKKPPSEVLNSPPHTTPSQAPVEMLPLAGFNDSLFHLLPANHVLAEDAMLMLIAKEDGRVFTLQPRTIQEMKDFKTKHPSAELYTLKDSGS